MLPFTNHLQLGKTTQPQSKPLENDGTSLDGRDAIKASQHGQVSVLRLGLGREAGPFVGLLATDDA